MKPKHRKLGEVRETWIEARLRSVLEEGELTNLPGAGRPIADLDQPYDPLWWGKKLLARENLSLFPAAMEMLRRVEQALREIAELDDARRVRRRLEALNAEIARANATTTSGPATTVVQLDIEAQVERWKAR